MCVLFFSVTLQAEDEIKGYTRRIQLLEDDLERTQVKLDEATSKLEDATKTADESER
jgi:tropomyosin-1